MIILSLTELFKKTIPVIISEEIIKANNLIIFHFLIRTIIIIVDIIKLKNADFHQKEKTRISIKIYEMNASQNKWPLLKFKIINPINNGKVLSKTAHY